MKAIVGTDRDLTLLMIYAFRYAVDKHEFQSMSKIENVLVRNIPLMGTFFVEQMISDIEFEQRLAGYREQQTCLQGFINYVDSYEKWLRDKPEAVKLHKMLVEVLECAKDTDIKNEYPKPKWSTDYMDSLKTKLKQETERRLVEEYED